MAFKLLIRFYFWMENPAFVFCFGKHTKPKGIGIGCHVFLFYYFPHTFRSFQKFNAYFDLFLKQKFQDPSIKSFRDEKSYFRSKSKDKLKIHAHFQQQIGYFSLFLSRNSEYSHHVRTKHLVQFDEPTLLSPKY